MPHLKILNIKTLLFQTHPNLCDSGHMLYILQVLQPPTGKTVSTIKKYLY